MPGLSDDPASPKPHLNGHTHTKGLDRPEFPRDDRVVYYVLAVILLAFITGVSLLFVSVLSDWQ